MKRRQRGRWGEEVAARFLAAGGYEILARNFQTRYGELDLVATRGGDLFVVEVKTWRSRRFGPPELHLGRRRRQRLRRVATQYLMRHGGGFAAIRFAFIFIQPGPETLSLRFLREA